MVAGIESMVGPGKWTPTCQAWSSDCNCWMSHLLPQRPRQSPLLHYVSKRPTCLLMTNWFYGPLSSLGWGGRGKQHFILARINAYSLSFLPVESQMIQMVWFSDTEYHKYHLIIMHLFCNKWSVSVAHGIHGIHNPITFHPSWKLGSNEKHSQNIVPLYGYILWFVIYWNTKNLYYIATFGYYLKSHMNIHVQVFMLTFVFVSYG